MFFDDMVDYELDNEALVFLVEHGYLHKVAESITKLYLRDGDDALVGGRRDVFQKHVILPYFTENCKRCHTPIPGCERIGSWENGGYCGWCNHQLGKIDRNQAFSGRHRHTTSALVRLRMCQGRSFCLRGDLR